MGSIFNFYSNESQTYSKTTWRNYIPISFYVESQSECFMKNDLIS